MSETKKPPVPASVYLVADNLDAVLAAGEDLLALTHQSGAETIRCARRQPTGNSPTRFVHSK